MRNVRNTYLQVKLVKVIYLLVFLVRQNKDSMQPTLRTLISECVAKNDFSSHPTHVLLISSVFNRQDEELIFRDVVEKEFITFLEENKDKIEFSILGEWSEEFRYEVWDYKVMVDRMKEEEYIGISILHNLYCTSYPCDNSSCTICNDSLNDKSCYDRWLERKEK